MGKTVAKPKGKQMKSRPRTLSLLLSLVLAVGLIAGLATTAMADPEPTSYTFGYAYDCQREPSFPTQTESCTVNRFLYPLLGYTGEFPSYIPERTTKYDGNWTLTYYGLFDDHKDVNDHLPDIAKLVMEKYNLSSTSSIPIFELKDGNTHIAYGVLCAVAENGGKVLFIGDTWPALLGGGGYVLSTEDLHTSGSANIPMTRDVTDIQDALKDTPAHTVTLTGGANATTSGGSTTQTGVMSAMTSVTYTANTGYYFESFDNITNNGITASWTSATTVVVSGTPTANASIKVPDAVPNTYTVNLDNQGATTPGATSVTATYNDKLPSIANNLPSKTGYFFAGYFSESNGGGTKYLNADGTPTDATWTTDGPGTIYAKWNPVVKKPTPAGVFTATDSDKGTLGNVKGGQQYQIDDGPWTDIPSDGTIDLTGLSPCTIRIIERGDGVTTIDSDIQEIKVTKADVPTAPTARDCTTLENNDGKLVGITENMQFKDPSADEWTSGTGKDVTGLAPGTYAVRVKPSGTVLASENQTLTVKRYIAPSVTFRVVGGAWADGTTGEKTVTLSGHEGDVLRLSESQIPKVGANPSYGHREGSWDTMPSVETNIDGDTVYTYTYPAIAYSCTKGDGSSWTKGSEGGLEFTFKRSDEDQTHRAFSHFTSVTVDGKEVASSDYTVSQDDGAVVTFKPSFLNTLGSGEHSLSTIFDDGTAGAKFTVAEQGQTEPEKTYPAPEMSNSRGGAITSTTDEVTYTVSQKVPAWASSVKTWVNLESVQAFTHGKEGVAVTVDGQQYQGANVTVEGQRVTVAIADATALRGKTVQFSYTAKLKDGADLSSYLNDAKNVASVPYKAMTSFDGDESRVASSSTEYVKFNVGAPKGNSTPRTTPKTPSTPAKTSTLPKTGDPAPLAAVATLAASGAAFAAAGLRRGRKDQ